jgi:hypothetical protein
LAGAWPTYAGADFDVLYRAVTPAKLTCCAVLSLVADTPPWSVEEQPACFVVRDHSGQALIKGTAVLKEYLPIRTALTL